MMNSMPNVWNSQVYVQGFIVNILLKQSVNMFEIMEIVESICEGVVETSYKKPTM